MTTLADDISRLYQERLLTRRLGPDQTCTVCGKVEETTYLNLLLQPHYVCDSCRQSHYCPECDPGDRDY